MKKSIWIVLPVVIIAVVVVAVFMGQRNTLSDQVAQLQSEKTDLTRQLNEADMAAKTAQELAEADRAALEEKMQEAEGMKAEAETLIQEAEIKVQDAETKAQAAEAKAQEAETKAQAAEAKVEEAEIKAQEAVEALAVSNTVRDELQANANTAAEQLQGVLDVLGVPKTDEAAELEEAKTALAAATEEVGALKETVAALTAERDALKEAPVQTAVLVLDAEGNTVKEFADASQFKLDELGLDAGAYTVCIAICNAAGEEIAHYDLPYIVAAAE